MKNKNIFLVVVTVVFLAASCQKGDFLDQVKTTDLDEESTFSDSSRTMQFLTRIYTDIGFSADPKRFGGAVGIYMLGDEVEGSQVGASAYNIIFQTGSVSSLNIPDDAWVTSYQNIRRVNVLLSHIPTVPLSDNLKKRISGEARFLRAWYYFILVKHYGGVPLIGDVVYGPTDEINQQRATYAECVDYIEKECDDAAELLPYIQSGLDYGRITKGACLALKSRLLLYAASPLFNGRAEMDGILGFPTYDESRWEKAAEAALDVIGLNQYSLYELPDGLGFQKVFTLRKNDEYILAAMTGNNRYLETSWDPPTRGGSGSAMPYQELVDAFGMKNGKPITDLTSGYDPDKPYADRDPRLDWSILYNGGLRLNTSRTISEVYTYFEAAQDGYPRFTKTGYFLRKMLNDNTIASTTSSTTERCLPLMRYAEILLNYAEASNEAGDTDVAYEQLKLLRRRAGILAGDDGNYGLSADMSIDDMRTVIQNERRVELAIEEHRYWDVRRWKIAENVSNKTLHGMRITRIQTAPAVYTYEKVAVRTPVFVAPKWYLWPIPQSEVNKSTILEQNPGW